MGNRHSRTRKQQDTNSEILRLLHTSQYELHRDRVPKPVAGTCTWITEHLEYKNWLGNETSSLLWLSADPGCGKSVIASFIVSRLEIRTDAIVCYFFFKDDSEEQRSATFALCAILHQLFSQRNALSKYAEEVFKAKGRGFTEEVDTLWDILVEAVTEGECGDVICVLDALDECEKATRDQLIRNMAALARLRTSGTPLKFLITSRPHHESEVELGLGANRVRLGGEGEVDVITANISRVIDNGIEELERIWQNHGGLGYLRDLLKSRPGRTFLWVSLVLEILKGSKDGSREAFTNIVCTAPHDLTDLYTKMLDESIHPGEARRILNIVVAATRPLTLPEMEIAFEISRDRKTIKDLESLPLGFVRTVKSLCGSFVRINNSRVYLVHQTAREFLVKGTFPGVGNWQYTICPLDSNYLLADICISYLALEDFENDSLERYSDTNYRRKGAYHGSKKYTFLDYAASNWPKHFRDSRDRQMELFDSTKLICERGSYRYLTWLRLYWRNNVRHYPFPKDFTHLMVASWLGQQGVVERLLEMGEDAKVRSENYGSALNVAALRKERDISEMLVNSGAIIYMGGEEYSILDLQKSQSEQLGERAGDDLRRTLGQRDLDLLGDRFRVLGADRRRMIEFLKNYCTEDQPGTRTPPSPVTTSLPKRRRVDTDQTSVGVYEVEEACR